MAFGALKKVRGEFEVQNHREHQLPLPENSLTAIPEHTFQSQTTALQIGQSLSNLTRQKIQRDLARLARFGANITDAHSCFIYLDARLFAARRQTKTLQPLLLAGHHTLSTNIAHDSVIDVHTGFLGWVLKNNRALHISPFERDSRSLGAYTKNEKLKSLLALPLHIDTETHGQISGIIFCDSKKTFSFSKLHQKLLGDLTQEIANTLSLHIESDSQRGDQTTHWDEFYTEALRLQDQIGMKSLDMMRIQFSNLHELEARCELSTFFDRLQLLQRLIRKAIPEAYPVVQIPGGDLLLLVDRMFSPLLSGRIAAIVEQESEKWSREQRADCEEARACVHIHTRRLKKGVFRRVHFDQALEETWQLTRQPTRQYQQSTTEIPFA